jgi:hypothetical protein
MNKSTGSPDLATFLAGHSRHLRRGSPGVQQPLGMDKRNTNPQIPSPSQLPL